MAQGSNKNEITNHFRDREIMSGLGEPCAKKAKCDQQRIYNERRKEKQCIPGVGGAGKRVVEVLPNITHTGLCLPIGSFFGTPTDL